MNLQPQDEHNEEYEWWQDYIKLHGVEPTVNFDRKKYADKEIPAYYTNSKIRSQVDCRLKQLAKENAKIWKNEVDLNRIKIKLANEIKSIDPLYYKELYPENNVTENY